MKNRLVNLNYKEIGTIAEYVKHSYNNLIYCNFTKIMRQIIDK